MKILVIASNPLVFRMARSVLGHAALEIRDCISPDDAVACYAAYRPDLVLTDWDVADADGAQITSLLRNAHPEARVVVLGDYDNAELRAMALAAGAHCYTLKDDMLDLVTLVQSRPDVDK